MEVDSLRSGEKGAHRLSALGPLDVSARRPAISPSQRALQQAVPSGERGDFPAATHAQFAEDAGNMGRGGAMADEELLRDLWVGQSLAEEGEDLPLATGEIEGCLRWQRTSRHGR